MSSVIHHDSSYSSYQEDWKYNYLPIKVHNLIPVDSKVKLLFQNLWDLFTNAAKEFPSVKVSICDCRELYNNQYEIIFHIGDLYSNTIPIFKVSITSKEADGSYIIEILKDYQNPSNLIAGLYSRSYLNYDPSISNYQHLLYSTSIDTPRSEYLMRVATFRLTRNKEINEILFNDDEIIDKVNIELSNYIDESVNQLVYLEEK